MSNDEFRTAEVKPLSDQHFEIRHSAVRYSAVQNTFQDSQVMRTTRLVAVRTEVTGQPPTGGLQPLIAVLRLFFGLGNPEPASDE
jgi:hypothetical protein